MTAVQKALKDGDIIAFVEVFILCGTLKSLGLVDYIADPFLLDVKGVCALEKLQLQLCLKDLSFLKERR